MNEEAILLRRWATERAEDAFAELVQRYLPLVYAAAVRRLGGDTHRARDVAQGVFCALAREAAQLARHENLTAWLYTATRHAAIDAIRAEQRRSGREKEAQMRQLNEVPEAAAADWGRLSPVLDAAMDELRAEDRAAVLRRYFQGRAFAAIGQELGISEEAARKRVERALERLRVALARRGVTSTVGALGLLLANETCLAVPAGLAASVTGAAVVMPAVAAGAAGVLGGLGGAKAVAAAVAAVAAVGGASGWWWQYQHGQAQAAELARLRIEAAQWQQTAFAAQQEQRRLEAAWREAQAAAEAQARAAIAAGSMAAHGSAAVGRRSETSAQGARPALGSGPRAAAAGFAPAGSEKMDTPARAQQRAEMHRRYDGFLVQERGLTAAQADRFVELKLQQMEARADLLEAVRAQNLRGDAPGVEALRAELYAPTIREMRALLGESGYQAYLGYEQSSFYRLAYLDPLARACATAEAPLTAEQTTRLLALLPQHSRTTRRLPTDIGLQHEIDWPALQAQAQSWLTPAQQTALQRFAATRPPPR